jgi:arabinose-5-phosphate isomerase
MAVTAQSREDLANRPADESDAAAARRVLEYARDGLQSLSDNLDWSFSQAVDKLGGARGRVIVTGMGKSGHVARKIAATLSSTGTPAQFVHPGEASHGDLGMIAASDAVLALSNSGETKELADLVAHAKGRGIPLVGMTSGGGSTLDQAADVSLLLPSTSEACPMGLAPTTSTTMMLALGDALAVALMERKGFSSDDYRVLHPGGSLGKSLLRVSDLMHRGDDLPLVRPDHAMSEVILEMTSKTFGCAGVIDETGRLIGIVTDGDLRRHMGASLFEQRAEDVMTASPKTVRAGLLAAEALHFMNLNKINCVFVVGEGEPWGNEGRGGKPSGFLRIHDCLKAGVS